MPKNRFNRYLPNDNKIILVIISGLGGLQSGPNLLTELQQAHRPNLNALARKSVCGMIHPVDTGIIPPRGAGLLSLLGYDASSQKQLLSFSKRYGLKACAFTGDPLYGKIAKRAGLKVRMTIHPHDALSSLATVYGDFDFFLLHLGSVEEKALSGDYFEKVKEIETCDTLIPSLSDLHPATLAITSDCSLPTVLKSISWHPVPLIVHSSRCRYDNVQTFDEMACLQGGLGILSGEKLMPLLLANAERCNPLSFQPK